MLSTAWRLALAALFCAGCSQPSSTGGITATVSGGSTGAASSSGAASSGGRATSGGSTGAGRTSTGSTVASGSSTSTGSSGGSASTGGSLSSTYPCDKNIGTDPAVVWSENFGEGSIAAFAARYDQVDDTAGQALLADVPMGSCSVASIQLISSGDAGANATDFYKNLAGAGGGYDEWYVRWYAKYQGSVNWHHSGVWFGGYDPPLSYPFPHAGEQPVGDDRFSVSIEPIWGIGAPNAQFDSYLYWMQMHSYEANPTGTNAYYGNAVVNQTGFVDTDDTWICLEVHVKLNTDPASAGGAAMDIWRDDVLMQHYDEQGPLGFWTADKFCPAGADETYCLEYPAPANTVLDLQWRSTTALQLNYFWPQNYITDPGPGRLQFADMVVATTRVGCLQ